MRPFLILLIAALNVALGAGGMWLYLRSAAHHPMSPSPPSSHTTAHPGAPQGADPSVAQPEIEVLLKPEALARTNLKTALVVEQPIVMSVRGPGAVQSNGYREVRVNPLVGGVVMSVSAQLGDAVKRGQPLVRIFSAELAQAQEQYLAMKAELEAEHKKLKRAEELAEIGAASRQELEEIQATHSVHQAHVQAAEQRLLLLGLSKQQVSRLSDPTRINSEVVVPAPIDGYIIARAVNQGQVVALGQELFTVTDLSEVWVTADLFEKDFAAVRVGSRAVISTPAYPGSVYSGRVSYIDPRVDPQTRTAKVRVEVANSRLLLKIGMYVDVSFQTNAGTIQAAVPRGAVQSLGSKQVVYVLAGSEPGRYIQRAVRLGDGTDGYYRVLEGLKPGETVVSEGSFYLRAESLRQHPMQQP